MTDKQYLISVAEKTCIPMLEKAIKSVYASVFYNGSRTYIQTTANLLSEEKMAVVIQSICGSEQNGLYYPLMSGVARSVNYYPIGNEKPEDGIVDLAFGLGKIVVDGGNTLRVNPKYPKKVLQLSDPKLALRDTQKHMYALDLRPGAFKISRNEGINLEYASVSEQLQAYPYPELVASTFSIDNNRMVPGVAAEGPRVVSFDAILRYGRFPLAQLIRDVLDICRKELMCEVEVEFAVDVTPQSKGQELVLKLLQVRPISEFAEDSNVSIDQLSETLSQVFVRSGKALGSGAFEGMKYIVHVPSDSFDSAYTREMADEVAQLNEKLKAEGAPYLLIGPGRWGSSDPWLGIPVVWSDISEAKMIVETAIPGFRIEPSQGTHFFQNLTSFGVGYFTINAYMNDGIYNKEYLDTLPVVEETKYLRHVRFESPIVIKMDGKKKLGVVMMPE